MDNEEEFRKSQHDEKIDYLLKIFEENRSSIMEMIVDLEKLKNKLDTIFPETTDARHMRFFEEKVKAVSSFFNVLLDMRKEINKSLKDEIELRRKMDLQDEGKDIGEIIDIRKLAAKVEKFKNTQEKLKEKSIEKAKKETDDISRTIDVTKVSNG